MKKIENRGCKIIIGTASILLVAITIVAFFFAGRTTGKLQKQLELGNRYLLESDYDTAIAMFDKAIEIDPMCVDAYIGLIKAYESMGNEETALEVAKKGFAITGAEELETYISTLEKSITKTENENGIVQNSNIIATDEMIYLKTLFECPTFCGVPWRDAGGVEEMHSLMPKMDIGDVTDDDMFAYYESFSDYSNLEEPPHFWYSEDNNGTIEVSINDYFGDNWITYSEYKNKQSYRLDVLSDLTKKTFSYSDGLYNYMMGNGTTIDGVVEKLGLDINLLKNEHKIIKGMSDLGEVYIAYDVGQYIFEIYGDQNCGLWLCEFETGKINLIIDNEDFPVIWKR